MIAQDAARSPLLARAAMTAAAALLVSSCAASPGDGGAGGEDGVDVLASFYPLAYVAQQVGGPDVRVDLLTPPGAEPHDLELSPARVRTIGEADLVLYLSGFQPAVDEAIEVRTPANLLDAASAGLLDGGPAATADAHGDEEDDHAEEEDAVDPHFWLDPTRLALLADPVARALGEVDPANAGAYTDRAADLTSDLAVLDENIDAALAACESRTIVTTHAAFGYLAQRYGLEQIPITGLEPETEPSPARMREVAAAIEDRDVTTVFSEVLVTSDVAETLANDLGLATAVLDPLEGQTDPAQDYASVMRANADALREALRCE